MYMNLNVTYLAIKLPLILIVLAFIYIAVVIIDSAAKHNFTKFMPYNTYVIEQEEAQKEVKGKYNWYKDYIKENRTEISCPGILALLYIIVGGIYIYLDNYYNILVCLIVMTFITTGLLLYISLGLRLYLISIIIIFSGMSFAAYNYGYLEAMSKETYESTDENNVIIDYFEDTYIIAKRDGNKITPKYTIKAIINDSINIQKDEIGPLYIKED